MIGSHFIKGWARTQNHVTLSSAEAELVALVKCSAELLGAKSMMRDFGVEKSGIIYADSSAALAIAKRKGAGKLRHINISCLWIQERQGSKELELRKVLGTENPADLMTKHLARQSLDKCMRQLNQHRAVGRARAGLDVQGAGKSTADKKPEAEPTCIPGEPVGDVEGQFVSRTEGPSKTPAPPDHVSPGAESAQRGAEGQSTRPASKRQAGKIKEARDLAKDRPYTRLNSFRICSTSTGSPFQTQCRQHKVADEYRGDTVIFQSGGQRHNRLVTDKSVRESICPLDSEPTRRPYIVCPEGTSTPRRTSTEQAGVTEARVPQPDPAGCTIQGNSIRVCSCLLYTSPSPRDRG